MLKIFLKTAVRQFKRLSSLSTITIIGLSLAFSSVILLSVWLNYELQYDRFYKKTDRLYKVYLEEIINGKIEKYPWLPFPLSKTLRKQIPEIANSTIIKGGPIKVKYDNLIFYEDNTCFTEANIFDVFDIKFIKGNKDEALIHKESVVITERIAKKYFGKNDPIGKTILVNDNYSFEITAVIKDIPKNSSIDYDLFILAEYFSDPLIFNDIRWGACNFNCYLYLKKNSNPEEVKSKIRDIALKYNPDQKRYVNIQPIKKSHFYSVSGMPTNIKNIRIMVILGIVIYLVAIINFINISLGQYHKRILEFKTKVILGSKNKQIAMQIILECALIVFISLGLSVFLSIMFFPFLRQLTGIYFTTNNLFNFLTLFIFLLLYIGTLTISSIPIAFFYTGSIKLLNRAKVLSSKSKQQYSATFVTFQFATAVLLIISVIVVVRQLNFITEKNLGLDTSNVITLPLKGNDKENYPVLKNELLKNSHVKYVTAAYNWPTQIGTSCGISSWPGNPNQERLELRYTVVDVDYFSTLGMKMVQGVPFSKKLKSDSIAFILNESAVKTMNLKEPVGAEINFDCWTKGKVIGVVKDFHFQSLHNEIKPLIIAHHLWGAQNLLIKLNSTPSQLTLNDIETIWKEINPYSPFSYQLLDHTTERMYRKEMHFKKLLFICSIIAIFLSAIGILGIILIQAQKRTKEIGIRKVNGAKVIQVMTMLNKDFVKWVVIAFIIACPAAWFVMTKWLENFAYRIQLSWWIFILAGFLTMSIALITVSLQSWRAARKNPVEALRYE